ncbi:MAG: DUF3419 family protein [Fidelibacterota bacterium]|jgi:S-adenosylmethionine-diacylglycerol 3-amino-3-carboxypropyl transferase
MNIFDNVLFAVTREDFKIEYEIIKDRNYKKILSVCSGGCVPLSLKTLLNDLEITVFDINTHQLKHLEKKVNSIKEKKYYDLNIDFKNDNSLNQSGKFEKMFQKFRFLFCQNISSFSEIEMLFNYSTNKEKRLQIISQWYRTKNIKKPFEVVFNDKSIEMVFSKKATQHAEPGTYIEYFYHKIMRSFNKENFYHNPFLQHIFLGYYLSNDALPYMLNNKENLEFNYFNGTIYEVPNIKSYDLVTISNLFDWSSESFIKRSAAYLSQLNKGAAVLLRQLNNNKEWYPLFQNNFTDDPSFDNKWQKEDRSMFYDHFKLYTKK